MATGRSPNLSTARPAKGETITRVPVHGSSSMPAVRAFAPVTV